MVNYRRNFVEGGCYFFTVTLRDRRSAMLTDEIDCLRQCLRDMRKKAPTKIDAVFVLPDHLHMVITLPEGDADYPQRLRYFKSQFTRMLKKLGYCLEKDRRGEHNLWQRRFWEHTIKDEADYKYHVDYIHYNPVKHKLAKRVKDWPYSSFHQYVNDGLLPIDWGCVNASP